MARRYLRSNNRKPLVVICSEGGKKSAEYYYFRHFANRNLRIQFSTGNSTDPKGMLEDLLKYIRNEDVVSEDNCKIYLVMDTDLNEKRINEIKEIDQQCKDNNIEIITSSPTFEIWFLMHYRNNKLKFLTSKDVKKEIERINGTYFETMDMYMKIQDKTIEARDRAQSIEQQINKDGEELLISNPHSSIYKVLDKIDEFNSLQN